MSIKEAIEEFLHKLEEIKGEHGEMFDTAVREVLRQHMYYGLRRPVEVYEVDKEFKMFTKKGDAVLQEAVTKFLNHPEIVKARQNNKADEEVKKIVIEMDLDYFLPSDHRADLLTLVGLDEDD